MLPPSCSSCGAPIPAVPPDPSRPDLCASCVGRSARPSTAAAPATRPLLVVRTRPLDGLVVGLAAAGLGGAAWWAAASFGQMSWWPYLSAGMGLVIGLGVAVGARKGGVVPALIALAIGLLAVPVAVYFIDRSLTIDALDAAKRSLDVPLWQGFGYARDVIQGWIDADQVQAAGWLLAPLVAAVVAGWPRTTPGGAEPTARPF